MKKLALMVALLTSCAALFQEHETDGYSGGHEPRCTTTAGWWLLDSLFGAGDIATALAVGNSHAANQGALISGLIVEGILHTVSGAVGEHWANQCGEYRKQYDDDNQATAPVDSPEAVQMRKERMDALKKQRAEALRKQRESVPADAGVTVDDAEVDGGVQP